MHSARGEYDEALVCYREQASIGLELGNRSSYAYGVGSSACVFAKRNRFQEALDRYNTALEVHADIGFRLGTTMWLQGIAEVFFSLATLESECPEYLSEHEPKLAGADWKDACLSRAKEHVEECLQISRELGKSDTLFSSQLLLARIDAAGGNRANAVEALERLLKDAEKDTHRADIYYRLCEINPDATARRKYAEHALELYTELWVNTPNHEYRERIDELTRR